MYCRTSRSALFAFLRLRSGGGILELVTDDPGRLTVFSSISHPVTSSFHETRRCARPRNADNDWDLDPVDLLWEPELFDLLNVVYEPDMVETSHVSWAVLMSTPDSRRVKVAEPRLPGEARGRGGGGGGAGYRAEPEMREKGRLARSAKQTSKLRHTKNTLGSNPRTSCRTSALTGPTRPPRSNVIPLRGEGTGDDDSRVVRGPGGGGGAVIVLVLGHLVPPGP